MVQSKALRKFLVPCGIFLVLVTVAIVKKMRTVAAGEEAKVVLCHIPPGNPENAHTIEVGESAVDAHLEHGDYDHLSGQDRRDQRHRPDLRPAHLRVRLYACRDRFWRR